MAPDCLCFGRKSKTKDSEKKDLSTDNESSHQCTFPTLPIPNPEIGEQKTEAEQSSPVARDARQSLPNTKVFNYRDLVTATNNFHRSNLLGEGGFGLVYKGTLVTGEVFAVKKLNPFGNQGDKEFMVEVLMLSVLRHPNLLTMLGYCAEDTQRILVLEFMPFGSLEYHLHDLPPGKEPLDWNTRMKIAAGVARGVCYLHNEADPPVIFRDLKPSNILLDEKYHPKLSDFGLAKFGPIGDKSHVSTRVMGTYGYCAPEYAETGKLTPKSDTFGFGVVLLEIISGRKAYDDARPKSEVSLVRWALPLLKDENNYAHMADPKLNGQFRKTDLHRAIQVSAMCLQEKAKDRPIMSDVVAAMDFLSNKKATEATPPRRSSPLRTPIGKSPLGPGKSPLSPGKAHTMSLDDGDREKAVAEAKEWGVKNREKTQQGEGGSSANA